ncbi:MAG: hypothetical protein IKS37_03025 [Solobacterium sp.]|nr:hypothetical protein [Solobacterium sp.]
MNKFIKCIAAGTLCFMLASCKSVSPEAQAVIDTINTAMQNTEHTVQEYADIQAQYEALDEKTQKEVSNYSEYQTKVVSYFADKRNEVNTSLKGQKFYFSDTEGSVTSMVFNGDTVHMSLYDFDGNGKHETASVDYEYICDGSKIRLNASQPMVISYSVSNGKVTLDSSYLTEDDIINGLQGSWTLRTSSFAGDTERNMEISGRNATYEHASEAYGYDGAYYYYGPYSGSITIDDGSVSINDTHGQEYFFSCKNGSVQLYHYDSKMSRGSGLKYEDGYYDAF